MHQAKTTSTSTWAGKAIQLELEDGIDQPRFRRHELRRHRGAGIGDRPGLPGTAAEPEPDELRWKSTNTTPAQRRSETFRSELRRKPGEWYVVHTYSGMENRVLQNLENRVSSLSMEDYIYEIIVPTEEVTEIRNGQRKQVKRTVLPGYVLVRMDHRRVVVDR